MKKYIVLLPFIIFGFTSCEDVIPVTLNDSDMGLYAIDAKITTIDKPYVYFAKSSLVTSEEEMTGISGAVVSIKDDASPANSITLIEDSNRKGYYTVPSDIDYYGVEGREYTVTIETEGVTLVAKDYLSRVEPIDSIQIYPSKRGGGEFLAIMVFSKETEGIGNYYKWEIVVNDTFLYKTEYLVIASDELVDGNYVENLEIFTDFYEEGSEDERILNVNDTVYIKQNSISQMAYDFYFQMMNQNSGGFLFSVPPSNAYGNFISSDGKTVLGMFTAQDVSISNKVIINEMVENMLK